MHFSKILICDCTIGLQSAQYMELNLEGARPVPFVKNVVFFLNVKLLLKFAYLKIDCIRAPPPPS